MYGNESLLLTTPNTVWILLLTKHLVLFQAKSFSEKSLAESCLDIIDETAEVAMSCEDFLEIDFPTLCEVLKRDTMEVKETALFDAAVRFVFF